MDMVSNYFSEYGIILLALVNSFVLWKFLNGSKMVLGLSVIINIAIVIIVLIDVFTR